MATPTLRYVKPTGNEPTHLEPEPVVIHGIPDGGDGNQGPAGPAGKSAYQVWLEEGHSGTEAEFLTWLEGPKGERGERGFQGDKGDPGDRGLKGDTGDKGDKGDPGTAGSKGDKGDPGAKGETGRPGTPDVFVATPEDLPDDLPDEAIGQLWVTELHGHLHLWRGVNAGKWLDMGQYTGTPGRDGDPGPKGDRGDPGTPGLKGDTGPKGEKGDAGERGLKGDKGDPGEPGKLIPTGGAAGYILAKRTQTDHDMEWVPNDHRIPIVSDGTLVPRGTKLSLVMNNIKISLVSTTDLVHGLEISTVSGEEIVDFRFGGHYDGAGTENYTMDGEVLTTAPVMRDSVILNGSRNPNEFWLRENGRIWRGHTFVSGRNAERASIWAQRIL